MRAKLWLMLAVAVVMGGGVGHEALAGDDSKPPAKKQTAAAAKQSLTPAQKAARKRILAQVEFMQENDLNCGCRHHFTAPASGSVREAPLATPLALKARVFTESELPGFSARERPMAVTDVREWAKVAPSGGIDVAPRLRRDGFVAGVCADLSWKKGTDRGALAAVVRLGSARAARTEITRQLRDFAGEPGRGRAKTYATFPVPGIPGAHGFTLTSSDSSGHNVIFADGPFTYHLGVGWGNRATNPPTRAQLIAAVAALYKRVHSRPAPTL